MKKFAKAATVIVTDVMLIAVSYIFAPRVFALTAPAAATGTAAQSPQITQNLPDNANAAELAGRWLALSSFFDSQNPEFSGASQAALINQWIVLNWLFGSNGNFNSLDQVSKWIVLNGLFGPGKQNSQYWPNGLAAR